MTEKEALIAMLARLYPEHEEEKSIERTINFIGTNDRKIKFEAEVRYFADKLDFLATFILVEVNNHPHGYGYRWQARRDWRD
ncbi:hypothetical protein [Xanthomonas nasturtii]|uniref:hypothetical protein n=1 Tax=Xanthomonas nasturtii TaxID=1843581 RepID=UPI0020114452|nr:hypothetical protein [Xanthomonas nasturtii]MCL1558329.1 hypothetical protein [Xanthomonas nasturtii]